MRAHVKLPLKINPLELCARGVVLEGKLPIQRLGRLADLLMHTQGDVTVRFEFSRDKRGQPTIEGRIAVTLTLACQRCGKAMSCDIKLEPKLCPIGDNDKLVSLPEGFEALWVADEMVLMTDLVE